MKTTTQKPLRVFPTLPRISAAEKEIITIAIGNDKYCRRWLKTGPAEHLVQHALEISAARKTPGADVEANLVAHLTKLLRSKIAAKRKSLK